ncbi:hypothetical protein GIB67_033251 [Kingdonia uniflora]|uniref:Uncharacterized protein n=1 Tax=Kingdonia uniflora TaxID=39325 RepID=A0A7J7MPU2_9MAGN|nr:hypothetical protein GIB67_033251 [Kingdonia uniflora]
MAPSIAFYPQAQTQTQTTHHPMKSSSGDEEIFLRRRNEELEREIKKSLERESQMREALERSNQKLRLVEEAEEMLCSQLGELEAEAADQARLYYFQIKELKEQLSLAHKKLTKAL